MPRSPRPPSTASATMRCSPPCALFRPISRRPSPPSLRPVGTTIRRFVPILDWLPRYSRADVAGDLLGGITVAALLIPQGMAYAQIAGLPPVTGLYASTVPILAYVVFGRARILGV